MKLKSKLGVDIVDEDGVQLLVRVGGGGWLEETKLILNSTPVKVKVEVGVGVWQKPLSGFASVC